ncbi:signal transduction histidine kinase, putative [Rhodospirillum centenum SW]|uniref:histidine kinase n=1 Tax=Rhodospirillum centenum (strain ATCC 51521 / SW) TaxID=414684 RepID=B6IYG6_RHOCS|nr:signal transduction histidine kinase, putative [Rhodospirillum centenum SW]
MQTPYLGRGRELLPRVRFLRRVTQTGTVMGNENVRREAVPLVEVLTSDADTMTATLLPGAVHHAALGGMVSLAKSLEAEIRAIRDPVARAALDGARSRVVALAQAQRVLADLGETCAADLGTALRELGSALLLAHQVDGRSLRFEVRCWGVPLLPRSLAFPLGLAANELIGNALRYAFRRRSSGRIEVDLRCAGGRLVLCVADDGEGISDRTLSSGSTGLWLVRAIAGQLGGHVDVDRREGTAISLVLPHLP